MSSSRLAAGRRGERIAARFLKRRGYRVIERNLRLAVGEADIVCIAPDRATVVVVEVKSRTTSRGDRRPESQVGAKKQAKLRQIAEVLRKKPALKGRPVRIDVVAVELAPWPRRSTVRHIPSAVSWSR